MEPDVQDGLNYWETQPPSLDGVLGGFGSCSLPRVDALGSRLFLLNLLPELSTVPSALCPLNPPTRRTRALDVGAGIGRVTADVLLHLFSDVVLLEPVDNFIQEALSRGRASVSPPHPPPAGQHPWRGIADNSKSVTFLRGTLQDFDPARPHDTTILDRIGHTSIDTEEAVSGFDVVWCQWCLGHLSDSDLAAFLRRSHAALRQPGQSLIVVKENLCLDEPDGRACTLFDEQDSSLTRSDQAWKNVFKEAGLKLISEKVQEGLPDGLYVVKMYALR
ncbi:alpha N-terminal protein methyltransferase 1 [Favolaschia claudopus]|uniref:Alpha N-terminal protein methyltransferase 1 n=1 Tax=Favolaschia claudopus TaxID=2862362 RepID=A0AAW0B3M1_9AGAR